MGFIGKTAVIIATLFAVYSILQVYGLFEYNSRKARTVTEIQKRRKESKNRSKELKRLALYDMSVRIFYSIFMSSSCRENHQYYIDRLDIRTTYLNRQLTPEELRGKYVLPMLLSIPFIPLGVFFPVVFIIPIVTIGMFFTYQSGLKTKISDEDSVIDDYFIDLYLLLYSKLRQGSRARLQGTVENYVDTLESSSMTSETKVMLKLAKYLLNLLSLYEDHVAIPKLRETYRSATIINFCNVASQSLNGVDNGDNLLSFKMQLVQRKTELMRKRQRKILASGERSIYLIWVILFIFIAVGWYSKLPTGMF